MRLVARFALAVTLVTAATPLIAGLMGCGGMSCCAHSEARFTVAMNCCPAPSVSNETKSSAAKERTTAAVRGSSEVPVAIATAASLRSVARRHVVDAPSSPPTRIRLAHLSTLLI
jgi:hypothetical protein